MPEIFKHYNVWRLYISNVKLSRKSCPEIEQLTFRSAIFYGRACSSMLQALAKLPLMCWCVIDILFTVGCIKQAKRSGAPNSSDTILL